MKLAGQSPSSSVSSVPSSATQKDPVARKKEFLRRRRMQADSLGANKVIEVMTYCCIDFRIFLRMEISMKLLESRIKERITPELMENYFIS